MPRSMVSTSIYLTRDQSEALKLLKHKTLVPTAIRLRQAVDLLLRRESAYLPGKKWREEERLEEES